ncbi:hypothetical protein XPA_007782 [Xanthoria parietina]
MSTMTLPAPCPSGTFQYYSILLSTCTLSRQLRINQCLLMPHGLHGAASASVGCISHAREALDRNAIGRCACRADAAAADLIVGDVSPFGGRGIGMRWLDVGVGVDGSVGVCGRIRQSTPRLLYSTG